MSRLLVIITTTASI